MVGNGTRGGQDKERLLMGMGSHLQTEYNDTHWGDENILKSDY